MTSERQLNANRTNARVSTGPKTPQGKIRSAQNARHHGLSVSVLNDPFLSENMENLAHEFVGEGAAAAFAHRAAEAQIDLIRIRRARHDLWVRKLESPQLTLAILSEISSEYAALDRYERRARSRRKFAMRELEVLPE